MQKIDLEKIGKVKSFKQLFVEDVQLEDRVHKNEPYGFADSAFDSEADMLKICKRVTKNNWREYLKYILVNMFDYYDCATTTTNFIDMYLNEKFGHGCCPCIAGDAYEYLIYKLDIDEEAVRFVKQLVAADNYVRVKYFIGQAWAEEFCDHDMYSNPSEVPAELDDDAENEWSAEKFLNRYEAWAPGEAENEASYNRGLELLEEALDEAENGVIDWRGQLAENEYVNMGFVYDALHDGDVFKRFYPLLNEEGQLDLFDMFMERVIFDGENVLKK